MAKTKKRKKQICEPGFVATTSGVKLRSYEVGALPIINHILKRMRLSEILSDALPADDSRTQLATHRAVMLMISNVLVAREPVYGVGEWAAGYAPDLLHLFDHEVALLNDDRMGRCLDRLFEALDSDLIMRVVRHVIREFNVNLDELHNDSTSITVFGAYPRAAIERLIRGRKTLAITFGHNKDHRPDLKQLLFILTVSEDGGIPLYFTAANGNTTDDTTHRATWDLLRELVGRSDFLYVADCKLATTENMNYIARHQGRFITVLPRSRKEDQQFRKRLWEKPNSLRWDDVYSVTKTVTIRGVEQEIVVDRFTAVRDELLSREGYRLLWYHSERKAQQDRMRRANRLQRATEDLIALRARLQGPKTRFGDRKKVDAAVQEILKAREVDSLLQVEILEQDKAEYKQTRKGRPGKDTQYVKTTKKRFDLTWSIDHGKQREAESQDGVFPLITNTQDLTAEEVLRAYKRQPVIEKRFSQLKTDFSVAPVYLKSVTRIHGLLAVYFFALMAQTLLERELRHAMKRSKIKSLPLYPEGRACHRPTARKLIDLFASAQRHELQLAKREPEYLRTRLTPLQKQILSLLKIPSANYGHWISQ